MGEKWLAIMMAAVIASIMSGAAVSEYSKHVCQTELGKAGRDAADIGHICR